MLDAIVSGAGPRVLLLHGFTQSAHSWRAVAEALEPDHEVVAVDLPGHGGSGSISADLWGSADLLAGLLRHLGDDPCAVVGYSLGGRLALHLALLHPDLVSRLVLLGATAGIDDADHREARRSADDVLARSIEHDGVDAFLERWLAQPMFAGLPDDPEDLAQRRRNSAAGLAASLRLAGTGSMDPPMWDRLGELSMPVLVLAGEHDEKFVTNGRRLAAGIGASASFRTVAGAGHAAHLERPQAFLALLRSFLTAT